jgi:hypothetical protein
MVDFMRRHVLTGVVLCTFIGMAMVSIADGQGPVVSTAFANFQGRIRDYDYIENADWVLATVTQPGVPDVQVSIRDPRFGRILETALDLQTAVDITYDPNDKRLLSVKLDAVPPVPPPPPMSWSVKTLSFDEASGKCHAKLLGTPPTDVFTRDVRAEGILATSLRSKKPVSYLETVPDGTEQRITRVKINVP